MLDSTSVRLCLNKRREFLAGAIHSAVSIQRAARHKTLFMYFSENVLPSVVDPLEVNMRPDTVVPHTQMEFTCSVSCTINVDCTMSWHVTNGFPNGSTPDGNKFTMKAPQAITSLNITCVVADLTAGYSVEATKTVEVTGNLVLFLN